MHRITAVATHVADVMHSFAMIEQFVDKYYVSIVKFRRHDLRQQLHFVALALTSATTASAQQTHLNLRIAVTARFHKVRRVWDRQVLRQIGEEHVGAFQNRAQHNRFAHKTSIQFVSHVSYAQLHFVVGLAWSRLVGL
jgi:hypothetical protein